MPRIRTTAVAAILMLAAAVPARADATGEEPACRRFASEEQGPKALAPRLARLCLRLVEAHGSARGLSADEVEAATRLGRYLAVIGELDLRRGAVSFGAGGAKAKATTDAARYLIAHRMGLLDIADALAPLTPRTAALR